MDNVTWLSMLLQSTAALLFQYPYMQQMIDLAVKSFVLLAAFAFLDACVGNRINSTSQHLLWLNAMLCLALLPLIAVAFGVWNMLLAARQVYTVPTALIELPVYASSLQSSGNIYWSTGLLILYLVPLVLLLGRLVCSYLGLRKLILESTLVENDKLATRLWTLRRQLGISRTVTLRISNQIGSPVSYGLLKPEIMLPMQAETWNDSIITDVLLHELCHIKRLDWLTTLLSYCLLCVFWINPLVWLAAKRLREESENSCDVAVLHAGRRDIDYAESLLSVANSYVQARRVAGRGIQNRYPDDPLLQTMLDQNTLRTRISRVLKENKMKAAEMRKETRKTVSIMFVISAALLGVLGVNQVIHAQQQPDAATRTIDKEMLPLNTVEAKYPTAAAEAAIEGWAHVRFTVGADGTVLEESISIVDAQPSDIFNNNAIAATKQFLFSPRIVAGQPVDVPNVQYVFRFLMSEESGQL